MTYTIEQVILVCRRTQDAFVGLFNILSLVQCKRCVVHCYISKSFYCYNGTLRKFFQILFANIVEFYRPIRNARNCYSQ